MSRPLGLGPIPLEPPISPTRQVIVRQAAALTAGVFMFVVMAGFGAAVLADSGKTLEGGGGEFFQSFIFGLIVVPALYGCERFFLRPRVRIDDSGVAVHNPWRSAVLPWAAIGGAGFDQTFTIVLAGGDRLRSALFGPTFSSPLTQRTRVDEMVALINAEASRRAGRAHDPEAAYSSEALISSMSDEARAVDVVSADSLFRIVWGWPSLAAYLALWTVACIAVAAV